MKRRHFNKAERRVIYRTSGGRCQICGIELSFKDKWHADHVVAFSQGGRTIVKNGQVLCPTCNLRKGNREMSETPTWSRPLRKWQQDAFASIVNYFEQSHRRFGYVLSAFPGSGKTTFALRVIHDWVQRSGRRFVIVIVPTSTLVRQFHDDADSLGIRLSKDVNVKKGLRKGIHGVVITYAMLDINRKFFTDLHREYSNNILIVADECHHIAGENIYGETKSWGDSFSRVALEAHSILLMTGTPWRSDKHHIPFVNYQIDEQGKQRLLTNYDYSYENALIDTARANAPHEKIARELMFVMMGGRADFTHGTEDYREELTPNLAQELVSPALRTALNPEIGEWFTNWFRQADQSLLSIRNNKENPYPTAAGLVIAATKWHAERYAEIIEALIGEKPFLVHYEEEDPLEQIRRFKEYPDRTPRWIVSINMISEGVDIPRLAVLFYATIVRQRLYFFQAVGRIIRWDRDKRAAGQQVGRVYVPYVEPLNRYAEDIKKVIEHVIDLRKQDNNSEKESGNKFKLFVPQDSIDAPGDVFITIGDKRIPARFVELADSQPEFFSALGVTREASAVMLMHYWEQGLLKYSEDTGRISFKTSGGPTWEDRIEAIGEGVDQLVREAKQRFFKPDADTPAAFKAIWGYLNKDMGLGPKKTWNEVQAKQAAAEVSRWLEDNMLPYQVNVRYLRIVRYKE
jgi:superfamily II DNA or RNA helicase